MNPSAHDFLKVAKVREREQLQDLLQIGQLTGRIAKLVHMLQRERGASNIWLCSSGKLFGDLRLVYAQEVDKEVNSLRQMLCQPDYLPGSALLVNLACALYGLEKLPALRLRISQWDITPLEAMEQFNGTLRHLLRIIPETGHIVADTGVARALAALFIFMQGKELVGQERAIGALGFTQGVFNGDLRQQLVDRIDSQQHCFETFCSMVAASLRQQYQTQGEPCREVEQLRRLACTREQQEGDASRRALRWFSLLTTRIDALRVIEEELIAKVMHQIQQALGQALSEVVINDNEMANFVAGFASDTPDVRYLDRPLLALVRQQAQQIEAQAQQLDSLKTTLEERKLIDKAKALLIQHQGYSEEEAWQALRKLAMNQNKRMVDVASAMVSIAGIWILPPKE